MQQSQITTDLSRQYQNSFMFMVEAYNNYLTARYLDTNTDLNNALFIGGGYNMLAAISIELLAKAYLFMKISNPPRYRHNFSLIFQNLRTEPEFNIFTQDLALRIQTLWLQKYPDQDFTNLHNITPVPSFIHPPGGMSAFIDLQELDELQLVLWQKIKSLIYEKGFPSQDLDRVGIWVCTNESDHIEKSVLFKMNSKSAGFLKLLEIN